MGNVLSYVNPAKYLSHSRESPVDTPQTDSELSENPDFYPAQRNEELNGRYKPVQKLGGGVYSEIYLATDSGGRSAAPTTTYRALKILTRDATEECRAGTMLEPEIMREISADEVNGLSPHLHDSFGIPEYEGGPAAHICMVMDVHGMDLATFRRTSPTKALPSHTVRIVLRQVAEAVAHVHKLGIVHTDIKPDNILFHTWMSAEDITEWLRSEPRKFGESHPLPNPPSMKWDSGIEQAKNIKVLVADFGQAQRVGRPPTVDTFSAFSLRAPEVILRSGFTQAIDIWAIGCIAFEMLVGRWLFHPVDGGDDWSLEDDHLAKMLEFTGEQFPASMLPGGSPTSLASKYFDDQGLHLLEYLLGCWNFKPRMWEWNLPNV
ncbi:hypothetical protein PHLGIDRAFT_129704, partial [Phlebiopsis gigantea 11061_1 CR5-6]